MSEKPPTESLADKLPDGLKKNLSPGEEIVCYLKSFVIAELNKLYNSYEHPPYLLRRKTLG